MTILLSLIWCFTFYNLIRILYLTDSIRETQKQRQYIAEELDRVKKETLLIEEEIRIMDDEIVSIKEENQRLKELEEKLKDV